MKQDSIIAAILLFLFFSPVYFEFFKFIKEKKGNNKTDFKRLFKNITVGLIISFFIISGFIITLQNINFLNYSSPKKYDKFEEITLEDFRGLELFRKQFNNTEKFAYIYTSIESNIDNDSIAIYSLFHPSRSYVYNRNSYNFSLLKHEKYHFKITELYSRITKKQLSEKTDLTTDSIKFIIEQYKNLERKFQAEYDFNTNHSYVNKEQLKYEKKIDSLLYLYKNFKKDKILLNK